jgi:hypothetical protein
MRPIRFTAAASTCLLLLALCTPIARAQNRAARVYGVLENTPARAAQNFKAGARVAVIAVGWNRYQPARHQFNEGYASEVREKMRAFRAAGFELQLSFGLQYAPAWIFDLPHARYKNQFGDEYKIADAASGKQIPNGVWSQAVREAIAAYTERVFAELGTDWHSVRLGGGWYGELNFPDHNYAGKSNQYWGFDDAAQGRAPGLPFGVAPCPVPGWTPGTPSQNHESARRFAEWYMESLGNYHDWQIQLARRFYKGNLAMLYPSWGIRPGQLKAAIEADLGGSTSPEKNGEIQRGFDFERFVNGVSDPNVIVYCTWLDSNPAWSDEASTDPARWSPAHWLSHLAQRHPLRLRAWGENTGRNDRAAMQRTFERIEKYNLMGVVWAFESDLYAPGDKGFATIEDFAANVARLP